MKPLFTSHLTEDTHLSFLSGPKETSHLFRDRTPTCMLPLNLTEADLQSEECTRDDDTAEYRFKIHPEPGGHT